MVRIDIILGTEEFQEPSNLPGLVMTNIAMEKNYGKSPSIVGLHPLFLWSFSIANCEFTRGYIGKHGDFSSTYITYITQEY